MPPKTPKQHKPFNHEELVNFKIAKKGQSSVSDQVEIVRNHMEVAERNFDAILGTAVKISKVFFNFRQVTTFNLGGVTDLVHDLRTIFRLLRSRLHRQFQTAIAPGRQAAAPGEQIPERIRRNVYTCLCPLTVLLQSVAQCLSDLKVRVPHDAGNNAWGTIQPLHKLLVNMEKGFAKTSGVANSQEGEYIGLAVCIMLHERNSRYLVTSTSPRYGALKALDTYSRALRIGYMNGMKDILPEESRKRVQTLETYSEEVRSEWNATMKAKEEWKGTPKATLNSPEAILGHNAAFRTTGDYMTACLLDHLRFQFGRMNTAKNAEQNQRLEKRDVHGTTSCAEWELYITLLHSPDPDRPHAPQFIAMTYGMPKARTWETNKSNQRPPAQMKIPPKPSPLPTFPKPT